MVDHRKSPTRSQPGPATRLGWVLAGGGARGAYEVGVLSYIFERVTREVGQALPLDVVSGTSIGAIHAMALANWAEDPRVGMHLLARRWADLALDDVVRLDRRRSFNMIRALLGWPVQNPSADAERGGILDPRPFEALVVAMMDRRRIADHIRARRMTALSVTATHVGTGRTTVFYQREDGDPLRWRGRARAFPVTLTTDHALASAAIPFLFPAVRLDGELYCDGSLRQHVPLSPARLLGAQALVVVNPRAATLTNGPRPTAAADVDRERAFPGPLFLLGKILNALTQDRIDADVEQLELVNRLLRAGERRFGPGFVREINATLVQMEAAEVHPIPLLQISASEDIGKLAAAFVRTPRFRRRCSGLLVRAFSRLAEGEAANEADLLSYLLFDGAFANELIALGRRDARRRHDEIAAFFRAQMDLAARPRALGSR